MTKEEKKVETNRIKVDYKLKKLKKGMKKMEIIDFAKALIDILILMNNKDIEVK